MFCGNCGKELKLDEKFCTNCGEKVTNINSNPINEEMDTGVDFGNYNPINSSNENSRIKYESEPSIGKKVNVLLVIISVIIPFIGLILFIALRNSNRKNSNACGIAALVGAVLWMIIIFVIIVGSAIYLFDYVEESYDEYINNDYNYDEYYYEDFYKDYEDELNKFEQQFEDILENQFNNYYNENTL